MITIVIGTGFRLPPLFSNRNAITLAFFTSNILSCHSRNSTGVTNNIYDGSSSVPVSHDSMIVNQNCNNTVSKLLPARA